MDKRPKRTSTPELLKRTKNKENTRDISAIIKTVDLTSDSDKDDDQDPYNILHEMTQVIKTEPRVTTIEEIELEEETSIMLNNRK